MPRTRSAPPLMPSIIPQRVMQGKTMIAKKKAVLDRIQVLEQAIRNAREYLESGKHGQWSGFRPLFASKLRDGKELPPHKDWVKNVFLPRKSVSNKPQIIVGGP